MTRAVDLCAAPGSWSQVLARRLLADSESNANDVRIVAVDLQTMAPIDGVTLIQGDITEPKTAERIIKEFEGSKAQLIVCDGAPDVTGQHDLDEFLQSQLLLAALNITTFIIEDGGTLVAKIFRGKDISLMIAQFRIFFEQVQVVKPKSSRSSSIEAFIVCRNYEKPLGYKPRMFDITTDLKQDSSFSEKSTEPDMAILSSIAPFLMCGDLNDVMFDPNQISDL